MTRRRSILLVLMLLVAVPAAWMAPTIYRVTHGLDRYESVPPRLPEKFGSPAVLVFSKTNGFRDDASIEAANQMFRSLASKRGWTITFTENGAVFNPDQLSRYRVVVWNSVSGDVLTSGQRAAFRDFIENGGGFVGIHGAGGDPSYRWRWYVDTLIGAQFIGHTMWPQRQDAVIRVEAPDHPAMAGVPIMWRRADEYYSFASSVRAKGYQVLATVDEQTYSPRGFFRDDLRMGKDHPVVWAHCVGSGRALYSALGHFPESYSEHAHRRMIENSVSWAMSVDKPECRTATR